MADIATIVGEASVRISPDTSRFVEDLRRDLQTDLRQATAGQNATVNLDVRVDTTAAKAALAAFRAEQQRNPIRLRVDVDEDQLRKLREALGGTASGAGNARGFEQLTAQVDRLTAALSRAATGAGSFGQAGESAARRVSTALSETEVLQARVTQGSDNLAAASLREEAAAQRVFAADQRRVAAMEQLERATADSERAEAALERGRRLGFTTQEALTKLETDASVRRERLAAATAGYATAESKLTDESVKHRAAETQLTAAEDALGEAMTRLIPQEQLVAAGRRESTETSTRLQGLERDLAAARQAAEADATRLARAEQELENGRTNGRTGAQRLTELEAQVSRARDTSAASAGRASQAERDLTRAHGEHETALSRLRRVELDSDNGTERRIGLFGRLGESFGRTGRLLSEFGRIGNTASQLFGGFSNVLGAVTSQSASFSTVLPQLTAGLGQLGGVAGTVASAVTSTVGALVGFGLEVLKVIGIVGALSFVIGNLSAAVVALPGVLVAGAAAFGVIKLATEGFGDAIKEANTPEELRKQKEALDKLQPSARAAALVINNEVRPAFKGLQEAVQQRFFEGFDKILSDFARNTVPKLKTGLLDVTDAVRDFAQGLARLVTGQQNADRLRVALGNVKTLIDNLAPGVTRLVDSFLNVSAATGIMRDLGGIIGDVTGKVGDWINEMLRSGQAERTFSSLRGVISSLVGVITTVATKTMEFAEAANPGVSKALDYVQSALQKIDFRSLGDSIGRAAQAFGKLLDSIPPSAWQQVTNAVKGLADKITEFANDPKMQAAAAEIVRALGYVIGAITTLIGWFQSLVSASQSVVRAIATVTDAVGLTHGAVDRLNEATSGLAGTMPPQVKAAMDGAAAAGRAGAAAIQDGVRIPIAALPGLTQAEFDKLPQIAQDSLIQSSLQVQAGAAPIPRNYQGEMSKIAGITKQAFDAIPAEMRPGLEKALAEGNKGGADVAKGATDPLKNAPKMAGDALAPTAPAVTGEMGKAADAGKAGAVQLVAGIDFAPIVDKARDVFGQVPPVITDGVNKAVTVTQLGGTRIVAALKLDGLREAARRSADMVPVAIRTALAQAQNEAKTGTAAVITAANFAGLSASAETETAKIPVAVQTNLTNASATVGQIGTAMVSSWQQNMGQLPTITQDTWSRVVQVVDTSGQQLQTSADRTARAVLQVFLNLAQPLYVAGNNMMLRLAAGITAGGQQAVRAAQSVAQQIQGLFPSSPPKWGPMSGSNDPLLLGERTMTRTADGITSGTEAVAKAAAAAASEIASQLGGRVSIPARATASSSSFGGMSSSGQSSDDALLRRALSAATRAAASAGASSSASSGGSEAAAGPSTRDIYEATRAGARDGTNDAMAGKKLEFAGDVVKYVTAGQRRNDRRAGRR